MNSSTLTGNEAMEWRERSGNWRELSLSIDVVVSMMALGSTRGNDMRPGWIAAAVAAVLTSGCGDATTKSEATRAPVRGLITTVVKSAGETTRRRYPGVLEATDMTALSFEVAGKLEEFPLQVGQRVKQGAVLAELDSTTFEADVESQEASVTEAKALLAQARDNLERKSVLFKRKATTRVSLDDAETDVRTNEARLTKAERALETARKDLTKTKLYAPFDGIINSVDASAFQTVSVGSKITSIYDATSYEVSFSVSYDIVSRLVVGTPAAVRPRRRPIGDPRRCRQRVWGERADSVSSFPVVVKLNEADPLIRAGMAVEVKLEFKLPSASGFLIPISAAIADKDIPQPTRPTEPSPLEIYVFDAKTSSVRRRTVTMAGIRDNQFLIVKGLQPGERVATAGRFIPARGHACEAARVHGVVPMDFITRFGLSKSRFTYLIMAVVVAMGVSSYFSLPKRENPAITIRQAAVVANFKGMAPERVENLLAIPIERKIREIGEVEDIETIITSGQVLLYVHLFDSVPIPKIAGAWEDLRNKMLEVQGELPEGTDGPHTNTDYGDVSIATIAVTGDGFSLSQIETAAEALQRELYRVGGVTEVTLYGEQDQRIWLDLNNRKLASVGVQLNQVLNDLKAQNVILPAGEIDASGASIVLEANGDLGSVEEIRNVLTKVSGLAGYVRLSDLVTVRRGYVDPKVKPVFFDGEPAIVLGVQMSETADIQILGDLLRQRIAAFEATQPIGIATRISTFQETAVTESVNGALSNVGQTFVVVFLVMLAFLGLKAAGIIACIVPFAVMFALISMGTIGVDIEQVSIAAVIISLGLLVDNGLVVVEDIEGRIARGVPPNEAAVQAGGQYLVPLGVRFGHDDLGVHPHAAGRWRRGRVLLFTGGCCCRDAARVMAHCPLCAAVSVSSDIQAQTRCRRAGTGEAHNAICERDAQAVTLGHTHYAGDVRACRIECQSVLPDQERNVSTERTRRVPDLHGYAEGHGDFPNRAVCVAGEQMADGQVGQRKGSEYGDLCWRWRAALLPVS